MFRENCELTPHISDGQKVVESIASFFPPLAFGLLLRDIFAPINQEELCETEVLNMEDIVNQMMDFLVEDWLENEGDSDFVDYLYAMGIHQHPSHAHPVQERKKREARRFFSTVRGTTIIRPKYIRRLMTTPRPVVIKNKKRKNNVPAQPSRKRRRASTSPSQIGFYDCIERYSKRVRNRGAYKIIAAFCKPFANLSTTHSDSTTISISHLTRQRRSSTEPHSLLRFGIERIRYCEGLQPNGKAKENPKKMPSLPLRSGSISEQYRRGTHTTDKIEKGNKSSQAKTQTKTICKWRNPFRIGLANPTNRKPKPLTRQDSP